MTDAPRAVADTTDPIEPSAPDRPASALAWATAALVVAIVLALSYVAWRYRVPYGWSVAFTYILTWGPLVIALAVCVRFWRRFVAFRWSDLYYGLVIGLVARAVGILFELATTGRMPGGSLLLGDVNAMYVFQSVIAPVILAPLIEEPFFRGLLQGSLARFVPGWVALTATSIVFTVVHTIANGWSLSLVVTLLVYALLAGYAVLRTRRLGPAVVGHLVFNGLAALISWPW